MTQSEDIYRKCPIINAINLEALNPDIDLKHAVLEMRGSYKDMSFRESIYYL